MDDNSFNPYSPPAATTGYAIVNNAESLAGYARRKHRKLHQILLVMAILGFAMGLFPEDSTLERIVTFVAGLSVTVLILGWCDIDLEERNLKRWRFFVPMMVLIPGPFIMIPIYLLFTRRAEGFVATAKAFAFFVLMTAVTMVASIMGLLLTGQGG